MPGIVGDCNKSSGRFWFSQQINEHLRTTRLASLRQTVKIASIQTVKTLPPFTPSKLYPHSLHQNSRDSFQVPIMDAQSDLKLEGVDCNSSSVPLTSSVYNSWQANHNHVLQIRYHFGFRCQRHRWSDWTGEIQNQQCRFSFYRSFLPAFQPSLRFQH